MTFSLTKDQPSLEYQRISQPQQPQALARAWAYIKIQSNVLSELSHADKGSLFCLMRCTEWGACGDESACDGGHKADKANQPCGRSLETLLELIYRFAERVELDGNAMGHGGRIYHETRLSFVSLGGDDEVEIFRATGVEKAKD